MPIISIGLYMVYSQTFYYIASYSNHRKILIAMNEPLIKSTLFVLACFEKHAFCSSIQLCVLLSHYLCFISFLYLYLYVLGDDVSISWGFLMRTKLVCVLIHIIIKAEVGTVKHVLTIFNPSCNV